MAYALISRRSLIASGAALGAAAALGGGLYLHPPAPGCILLCQDELDIVEAIARVMFRPGKFPVAGGDGKTGPLVDQVVALYVDPAAASPFRYLLRAIQIGTLASRGVRFTQLDVEEAQEVLDVWAAADLFPRRLMSDSFQAVIGMAFLRRPEVLQAIGHRAGCAVGPRMVPNK